MRPRLPGVLNRRLDIDHYAMLLACVARLRSEDPWRKVGAVALSPQNRVVATAYNGLRPGLQVTPKFWADREGRLPYVIHAEVNLCSLFQRGDVKTVAVTTLPCASCAAVLVAHDVKRVVWGELYHRDRQGRDVLERAGVQLVQLTHQQLMQVLRDSGVQSLDELLLMV